MKTLIMTFALVLGTAGCLGGYTTADPTGSATDMAHASTGTGGTGSGGNTGSGGTGGGGGGGDATGSSTDMALHTGGGGDMAGAATGTTGTKAFGDLCTVNGDCQSGLCEPFAMQTVHRCTKTCTVATQTADCPAPPSAGTCTNNGYCKFNN